MPLNFGGGPAFFTRSGLGTLSGRVLDQYEQALVQYAPGKASRPGPAERSRPKLRGELATSTEQIPSAHGSLEAVSRVPHPERGAKRRSHSAPSRSRDGSTTNGASAPPGSM